MWPHTLLSTTNIFNNALLIYTHQAKTRHKKPEMNFTPPRKKLNFLLIISLLLLSLHHQDYKIEAQNSDKVVNLPEQPSNPKISHFSGYVNVNQENTRSLFFWFFEALSESPSTRHLVLWLNGGNYVHHLYINYSR